MSLIKVKGSSITGDLPAISGANLTGISAGITMFDAWYVTSTQTHSSGEHTWTSWSRMSNESAKKATNIGSAMTQSSGVFTFPTTGKYWVMFKTYCNGNSTTNYAGVIMKNNSNVSINEQYTNRNNSNDEHNNCMAMTFIDVDDVTDNACKIKFNSNQGATSTWASGGSMETQAFFVRIGDT
jgi:hypothetical protein|tara:strand:- start:82 stop:627 length:546 start_codon:yes stop_codon:yes gene_type:complete